MVTKIVGRRVGRVNVEIEVLEPDEWTPLEPQLEPHEGEERPEQEEEIPAPQVPSRD